MKKIGPNNEFRYFPRMSTTLDFWHNVLASRVYWQGGKRSLRFAPLPYIRYYTCVNIAKWFCSVNCERMVILATMCIT